MDPLLDLRAIQSNMLTKPNNTGLSQDLPCQGWIWSRRELREEGGEDPWVERHPQGRLPREVVMHVQRGGGVGQLGGGSEAGRVRRAVPPKGCIARQGKLDPQLLK